MKIKKSRRVIIQILLFTTIFSCSYEKPDSTEVLVKSEIEYRLELIKNRIAFGKTPTLTQDFILAGVTLDPRFERRFTNFSGDQAGRYLTALSLVDIENNPVDLHRLLDEIITTQKPDGRFGADTLSFAARDMEGPQMALLWGNGRLLAGLLDYYERFPYKKQALNSAEKLATFLENVTSDCIRPEIVERFKTMGALGYICFTQITEGLAKLYKHTGNEKYLVMAEKIYPMLPEFGIQHSHGYLNTVRGVAYLYETTLNPVHLEFVETVFQKIVNSTDYLITGGVPEFFGNYSSADGYRDEGCSEADFLMLCIQLWKLTGKKEYLEKAEYSLVNHMFYNQYNTGDFGAHPIEHDYGFTTANTDSRAWWCCNYHGLNALVESKNIAFTERFDTVFVNLFFQDTYENEFCSIQLDENDFDTFDYDLKVIKKNDREVILAVRIPDWSEKTEITVNNKPVSGTENKGYLLIKCEEKQSLLKIQHHPLLRLLDTFKEEYNQLGQNQMIMAALVYGPYLLGIDNGFSPLYLAEPSERNIIYLDSAMFFNPVHASREEIPEKSFVKRAYLKFPYVHESMHEISEVVLRPISENTYQINSNVKYWNLFEYRLKNQ